MATKTIDFWRAWKRKKKNKLFPLTPFACGQWGKKVNGHVCYFGPLHDPENARNRWLDEKDHLLAGRPVRQSEGYTVGALAEAYIEHHEARAQLGQTSHHTLRDINAAVDRFLDSVVGTTEMSRLTARDFERAAHALYRSGLRPRTIKNRMSSIRDLFSWADQNGLCKRPNYGTAYKPPKAEVIEEDQERHGVDRFWDRGEILVQVHHADVKHRLAILLGINLGYYAEDTLALPLSRIHLGAEIPFVDFRRVKNRRRRSGVLWPETVDAIEDYLAERKPTVETDALFLNQYGRPYQHLDHGVRRTFNAMSKSLGVKRSGRSLGSLRHTFATIATDYADEHGGRTMVALVMGHTGGRTMTDRYSQRNTNELIRLKRIADAVRSWLFYGSF